MTRTARKHGEILYDGEYGHVCSCSERLHPAYGEGGLRLEGFYVSTYDNTVSCDRASGTESGSFFYTCGRCGAGRWSGL